MTLGQKRRRDPSQNEAIEYAKPDEDIDIYAALAGKKAKFDTQEELDDELLQNIIQSSVSKRNIKGGVDVLKKAKGKGKLGKGEVGGGSFQSMGLHPWLLRSLTLQGYKIPTPIQRLAIPALLANPPCDLVGMARTGSGKSLAYLVPLMHRLGGRHAAVFGARALILLPTRELALQILKVGKELARGWHSGSETHAGDAKDSDDKKSQSLRWGLIVGGEGMDEQFEMITNNPDVVIATPGRLLHLIVEMNLDLKSVQYVVFDEADRLFEMGFETALNEILHRLPTIRQTLLFSATLPRSLVDFAKAGLQEPKLIRLDAESKISSDLRMAFFSVKQTEKDACLLALLRDVIKVPYGRPGPPANEEPAGSSKTGKAKLHDKLTAPHQTLIFAATKHHVEYLLTLLTTAGYAPSHIYGSLDQSARTIQMDQFRRGHTSILVVTDVAARGIDIPVLENVVNYDFPHGARVFVHRVGRTARAGRQGWAWSFVTNTELPYLLDLQLFLSRPLKSQTTSDGDDQYSESLILGTFPREKVDEDVEHIRALDNENRSLPALREVMKRGHAMYERSKGKASPASYKRAKEMMQGNWSLAGSESGVHPVLLRGSVVRENTQEDRRQELLKAVSSFTPSETVFEVGKKGDSSNAALMKERRRALSKAAKRAELRSIATIALTDHSGPHEEEADMADEGDIAAVFENSAETTGFRDDDFYMAHFQKESATDKGYSLRDGASSFAEQARSATFDLAADETLAERRRRQLTWDTKKKKFTKGDGAGADNVKMVKTEGGTKLPATYRSGRFEEWKAKTRVVLPRTGEAEGEGIRWRGGTRARERRFKHTKMVAPKPLDKFTDSYDRKVRQMKKRAESTKDVDAPSPPSLGKSKKPLKQRRGQSLGRVKSELKTTEQIRKQRKLLVKRKAKNSRQSRKKVRR